MLYLIVILNLYTINQSNLIAGIVTLSSLASNRDIIGLTRRAELTHSKASITQTVVSIVHIVITVGIVTHEVLEVLLGRLHILKREVGISQAILCHDILLLGLGGTTNIVAILLLSKLHITISIGYLTLPVDGQRRELRVDIQLLGLVE